MVRIFKIDAAIRNAFPECICGTNRKASSANQKASSENREVFFQRSGRLLRRAKGSYTHKFSKRGAASLMYCLCSHLGLPHLRLGLPRLHLSRNSRPATEGFPNCGINFKDVYRNLFDVHLYPSSYQTSCEQSGMYHHCYVSKQWASRPIQNLLNYAR